MVARQFGNPAGGKVYRRFNISKPSRRDEGNTPLSAPHLPQTHNVAQEMSTLAEVARCVEHQPHMSFGTGLGGDSGTILGQGRRSHSLG